MYYSKIPTPQNDIRHQINKDIKENVSREKEYTKGENSNIVFHYTDK